MDLDSSTRVAYKVRTLPCRDECLHARGVAKMRESRHVPPRGGGDSRANDQDFRNQLQHEQAVQSPPCRTCPANSCSADVLLYLLP